MSKSSNVLFQRTAERNFSQPTVYNFSTMHKFIVMFMAAALGAALATTAATYL
jgi:hypothetical protein